MISMDFTSAKAGFFDRESVVDAVDKAKRKVLSKFGAFVRTRAKTSIRKRKGVSPPFGPPYSHEGSLRKLIFFSYDKVRESVVIGPVLTAKPTGAPEVLEYGGTIQGDGRVIFITNEVGRDKTTGKFKSAGKTRVELNGTIRYRPRPFMGPAFEAEKPKLPQMWKDSVK